MPSLQVCAVSLLPGPFLPALSLLNFSNTLRMLTPEFTQAVDALIQDTTISNKDLNLRASQYLRRCTNEELGGPPWARRIRKESPGASFSTSRFITRLHNAANELKMPAAKRYICATICVCAERVIPGAAGTEGFIQALDEVTTVWTAFLLWPSESVLWVIPPYLPAHRALQVYACGAAPDLNPKRVPYVPALGFIYAENPPETEADWEGLPADVRQAKVRERDWRAQVRKPASR